MKSPSKIAFQQGTQCLLHNAVPNGRACPAAVRLPSVSAESLGPVPVSAVALLLSRDNSHDSSTPGSLRTHQALAQFVSAAHLGCACTCLKASLQETRLRLAGARTDCSISFMPIALCRSWPVPMESARNLPVILCGVLAMTQSAAQACAVLPEQKQLAHRSRLAPSCLPVRRRLGITLSLFYRVVTGSIFTPPFTGPLRAYASAGHPSTPVRVVPFALQHLTGFTGQKTSSLLGVICHLAPSLPWLAPMSTDALS